MRIVPLDNINFEEITSVLNNGGLVIYPSDTSYGLGCDPCNKTAVKKLLEYKYRREGKAVSIAVDSLEMAGQYVDLNPTAKAFMEQFLPGPYTVICKSLGKVIKELQAEDASLGIRIPDKNWLLDLIRIFKKPITSTSANQSYKKNPYKVSDILEHTSSKGLELIDLIIDGGELPYNPPSTVINTVMGQLQVLRKGKLIPEGSHVHEIVTSSEQETIEFARQLYSQFKTNLEYRSVIFALQGDLGAGKTHFTKGLALEMGINDRVTSPTFILSNEYKADLNNYLYHIDTWRLESVDQFDELGISKMLERKGEKYNVLSIEWADKVQDKLRQLDTNNKILWIEIVTDQNDPNLRKIKWSE